MYILGPFSNSEAIPSNGSHITIYSNFTKAPNYPPQGTHLGLYAMQRHSGDTPSIMCKISCHLDEYEVQYYSPLLFMNSELQNFYLK
jgi:hypothetical protein